MQLAYYGDIISDGSRDEQRFAYPVLILLRNWSNLWSSEKIVAGVALLAAAATLWPWIAAVGLLLWSVFVPVERWSLPLVTSLDRAVGRMGTTVLRKTNEHNLALKRGT